jgi:hypothetical protein
MTDFSSTLIRCSALPMIMTEPTGKSNLQRYTEAKEKLSATQANYDKLIKKDGKMGLKYAQTISELTVSIPELEKVKDEEILSETCKSHLIQNYVLSKYGRVREITTKQMVKGTITEEDAIELFSVLEGRKYNKNTERIKNPYICGTPDLFSGEKLTNCDEIIDIKSCWDIFTFLKNVDELESADDPRCASYYWQIQGYLALTNAKIGTLAFSLVNTPDSIVEGEKYNLLRRMDVATEEDPSYKIELQKLLSNRKFDDIPFQDRLLTYSIERNDDDIMAIYKRVIKCREFLAEFEERHLMFSKKHRKTLVFEDVA